jgi:site-specific DNA recombinase
MDKAILYIRVSTDEQAEKGYSQRNQEEVLRRYVKSNQFRSTVFIMKIFQPKHLTGLFGQNYYLIYARTKERLILFYLLNGIVSVEIPVMPIL